MSKTFYVCPASSHSKSAEVEAPPSPISHIYICLSTHPLICPPTHQPIHHTYVHLLIWLSTLLSYLPIHPLTIHTFPLYIHLPIIPLSTTHSYIHPFVYSLIHLPVHPPANPSFRYTHTYPLACLLMHPSIHPPPHLHMPSSTHSSTHPSIHLCFCHSSNCSSINYTSTKSSIR